MDILTGRHKICVEIAEAFGIKHCKSLDLRMRHDEVVSVAAEFRPDEGQARCFHTVIKKYNVFLSEKKEQE